MLVIILHCVQKRNNINGYNVHNYIFLILIFHINVFLLIAYFYFYVIVEQKKAMRKSYVIFSMPF